MSARSTNAAAVPAPNLPAAAPSAAAATDAEARGQRPAEGYLVSSLDLRAGLELSVVGAAMLPADVWRELLRLQALWHAAGPGVLPG